MEIKSYKNLKPPKSLTARLLITSHQSLVTILELWDGETGERIVGVLANNG